MSLKFQYMSYKCRIAEYIFNGGNTDDLKVIIVPVLFRINSNSLPDVRPGKKTK